MKKRTRRESGDRQNFSMKRRAPFPLLCRSRRTGSALLTHCLLSTPLHAPAQNAPSRPRPPKSAPRAPVVTRAAGVAGGANFCERVSSVATTESAAPIPPATNPASATSVSVSRLTRSLRSSPQRASTGHALPRDRISSSTPFAVFALELAASALAMPTVIPATPITIPPPMSQGLARGGDAAGGGVEITTGAPAEGRTSVRPIVSSEPLLTPICRISELRSWSFA
jgi:hypothetical protein